MASISAPESSCLASRNCTPPWLQATTDEGRRLHVSTLRTSYLGVFRDLGRLLERKTVIDHLKT
jgi:hypothetical protein